jgi:probable addiction module antidote protein
MTAKTKTKTKTRAYDVAEHLRTPEEMALYLDACIIESDGDPSFVAKAIGDIARAKGMTALARETGLGRESLYKALSATGNPELGTVLKITRALGVRLTAVPA